MSFSVVSSPSQTQGARLLTKPKGYTPPFPRPSLVARTALSLEIDEETEIPSAEISLKRAEQSLNHPRSWLRRNYANRRFQIQDPGFGRLTILRLDDAPTDHATLLEFALQTSQEAPKRPHAAFVGLLKSDPFAKYCLSNLPDHEIVIGKTKIFVRFSQGRAQAQAFADFLSTRGIAAKTRPQGKVHAD